jgi:hypothetical protein
MCVLYIVIVTHKNYVNNNFFFFFFSECMVLGCLASWAVNVLFQWDPLSFYLVHILIWFLSDYMMLCVVQVNDYFFQNY